MNIGKVIGTVIATQKSASLRGQALKVLVALDASGKTIGSEIVAGDVVGARLGDKVLWVEKREASLAFSDAKLSNAYPVDAAIVGIIDDIG